ncbi:hypothetical protein PG995_010797 [Apiospora arundinis]
MDRKSRNKVIGRTELLEHILVYPDLKTLLISAQRVSTRWRELISHSPTLQRRLFFRSMPAPTAGPNKTSTFSSTAHRQQPSSRVLSGDLNPLLVDKFSVFFYERAWILDHRPAGGNHIPTAVRNSLRKAQAEEEAESLSRTLSFIDFESLLPPFVDSQEQEQRRREAEAEAGSASEAAGAASFLLRPEASWRRMLVSQPPMRHIGFFEQTNTQYPEGRGYWRGHGSYRFSELHIDDDDDDDNNGLRMGELYDAVAGWVARHRLCSIAWKPTAILPQSPYSRGVVSHRDQAAKFDLAGRVDLLLRLEKAPADFVHGNKNREERMRRGRKRFAQTFLGPETGEKKPPLYETPSMKWRRYDEMGNEVVEGYLADP